VAAHHLAACTKRDDHHLAGWGIELEFIEYQKSTKASGSADMDCAAPR
jgi:hypothetical protein